MRWAAVFCGYFIESLLVGVSRVFLHPSIHGTPVVGFASGDEQCCMETGCVVAKIELADNELLQVLVDVEFEYLIGECFNSCHTI